MGYSGSPGYWQIANPGAFSFPNPPDNGIYMAPVWIHHNNCVRGYLKGLWCPLQHLPLAHNDTFSGTGNLTGKSFLAQLLLGVAPLGSNYQNGGPAECFVETSDTWS